MFLSHLGITPVQTQQQKCHKKSVNELSQDLSTSCHKNVSTNCSVDQLSRLLVEELSFSLIAIVYVIIL